MVPGLCVEALNAGRVRLFIPVDASSVALRLPGCLAADLANREAHVQ